MKNRERYITKHNEYDLMMTVKDNTGMCAVDAVGGSMRSEEYCDSISCEDCIQKWLNEEESR